MDTAALKDEALDLFKGAVKQIRPTPEDQEKLADWTLGYGEALLSGEKDKAQGFLDAIQLKAAQYAIKAEDAREKFIYDALMAAGRIGIALL